MKEVSACISMNFSFLNRLNGDMKNAILSPCNAGRFQVNWKSHQNRTVHLFLTSQVMSILFLDALLKGLGLICRSAHLSAEVST